MFSTERVTEWFDGFTNRYKEDGVFHPMLDLKYRHSKRVSAICSQIARSLCWDEENDSVLAAAVGLLHDIGRFPQYDRYSTFYDSISVDHGDLGAERLNREFDWSDVPPNVRENIITAVRLHNKKEVPSDVKLGPYKWTCLVRDSDKIDIYRMVQRKIDNGTIFEMLPGHIPAKGLSPALVEEVRSTGTGTYANARTLQDYRLIQLTWGCDLNFSVTAATLKEEKIIDKITRDLEPYGIGDLVDDLTERIYSMI